MKKMKRTKWNEKLQKYAGIFVPASEFKKDGLKTEGYVINEDGSLGFRNELRSLNAASDLVKGTYCNYWSSSQKGRFLKAAQKIYEQG
jgi:hypothetical protein